MTDTNKIIERIEKLEVALSAAEHSHYRTSNRCFQNLMTQIEKMEMDFEKLDRKVGYIRRTLTTFAVILGFIAYEIVIHWVMK